MSEPRNHVIVEGLVAQRDKQPYIRLTVDGHSAQLSIADARNVAGDIVQMCARTEADAMIIKFFEREDFPPSAGVAIMRAFREFRLKLDTETVERNFIDPEPGDTVQ